MRSVLSLLILIVCTLRSTGQAFDYEAVMAKIRIDEWSYGLEGTSTLDTWVADQQSDGSWAEFQYGFVLNSGSNLHVRHLWSLARACTNNTHPKYNDAAYKEAIRKGLEYWKTSNTSDVNWWYKQIDWPKKLGAILILMREFPGYIPFSDSPGIDEAEVIALFRPTSINDLSSVGEGANMLDFGLHYVYRGILTEDSTLLVTTRNYLDTHFLAHIQSDLSFHEHGAQLHIASYGLVYTSAMVQLAYYLSGSPAAFDINGLNFSRFLAFVRDVQLSSIRGRKWDFSVLGRGISRNGASRAYIGFANRLATVIDTDHAAHYQYALDRVNGQRPASYEVSEFHQHYWTSDYTQHSRSGYLYTVRAVSRQTAESETGNTENLKANYFSYGANFIAVDGDEYFNIMPVWDWSMIPGITFKQTTSFPVRPNWGVNIGNTRFVGGVSDDTYGASVLHMDKHGVKAKKSWFFFEDEIVCLGSGITDASGENIRTTLNQCLGAGSSVFHTSAAPETIITPGDSVYAHEDAHWIQHDRVAYYFPYEQDVKLRLGTQSGSWNDINHSQSDDVLTEEVFKLWIDHGNAPIDNDYAYVVVPDINNSSEAGAYDINSTEIISNTSSIQAVKHHGLNTIQVVFYEAGALTHDDMTIEVSEPCILMLRNDAMLSMADPTQLISDISYTITIDGIQYSEKIDLPEGNDMEGSSISFPLTNGVPVFEEFSAFPTSVSLYPNPSSGKTIIDLGAVYYDISTELYSINGRMLYKEMNTGSRTIHLDPDVPSGIYLLRIISGDAQAAFRYVRD